MERRKKDFIELKRTEGWTDEAINTYISTNVDDFQCKRCNGQCHPESIYQTFSASPSTCMNALLCPKVRIPQLDMQKMDLNFNEVPGGMDEFAIHEEECCYGNHMGLRRVSGGPMTQYPKCGWDARFSSMPLHTRIEEGNTNNQPIEYCLHACPDEYDRCGKVTWMDFIKVARSPAQKQTEDDDYGGDDGVRFQTEWLPVDGSVPEFFAHLIRSIDAYLPHAFEIRLSNRVDKCAQRAFIVSPATDDECPEEYKGTVSEVVDFASDIHAKRQHDLTCSFPESHKCEVHHLTFDPKFISVDEIEKSHPRSARMLMKRGVERVLRPENVVIYCFSKAKSSAAYNQQSTSNIISIIKHGILPDNVKCEAFLGRKRIPGGDRMSFPSLDGDKLDEWENMPPLYPQVKRWRRSRDGCAAQYQGKGAFLGWQTMMARHGIICEDRRKISMHGKDIADGDGSAVSGMVRSSFQDDYGKGTQNLVRHLAYKYPMPNLERRNRYYGEKGLYATTKYIYMFLDEHSMDESIVAAQGGYRGSSRDHYYQSVGVTGEAARLLRRERACGCKPCLQLKSQECELTPANVNVKTGTTPRPTSLVIQPLRQSSTTRHTRNARNPLPEFCMSLSVGGNVIVRVSDDERSDNPNEEYFVAKIEGAVKQLDEDGVYSAVTFRKNDWIVSVCWYNYVESKTNRMGDRFYTRGFSQWIPCGSIIRTLAMPVKLTWSGQYHRLSRVLNDHIEQHGNLY